MVSDCGFRIGPWAVGAGVLIGATLLAGRLSGLYREIELAATFGVSTQADAAVLLLTLPDLLVNLLLSGGLSAALIPRIKALPTQAAQILLRQAFFFVFLLFSLFAIILGAFPEVWFSLVAPGLPAHALPPSSALIATALAIPLAAASGVTTAGLNAQQRFLVAGCGTLIFNVAVIGALVAGRHGLAAPLLTLGIGIASGAALRLGSQLINMPGGWVLGPVWRSAVDLKFLSGFLMAVMTASLMLLVPVIVRALASTVSSGSISAFNYATKLVELPAGVLVTSLATVALARLSEHYGGGDRSAARNTLHDGVRRSLTNAIGAGILIAYFAGTFVELALARGAMQPAAIERVTNLAQILMTGLPFLAVAGMAIADLNAQEKPGIVLKSTLGCLLLLPVLALPGMWFGSEAMLAWAIVAFQVVHALWLARWSGLVTAGGWGWCNGKMAACICIVACISIVTILLDLLLQKLFWGTNLATSALALIAISAVIILPQRVLNQSLKS